MTECKVQRHTVLSTSLAGHVKDLLKHAFVNWALT